MQTMTAAFRMVGTRPMNHYGAQAQTYWQQHRAAEYAQIEDPERYFTDLGNQIATEIERRRNTAEQQTGAGQSTDFLANLQSLNAAASVTDEVMREMAFTEPNSLS
jgi:hypothetical protein